MQGASLDDWDEIVRSVPRQCLQHQMSMPVCLYLASMAEGDWAGMMRAQACNSSEMPVNS